jgi:hypothetical protein
MGRGFKHDSKLTTNHCFSLDIRFFKKHGYLENGNVVYGDVNHRFRNSGRTLSTSIKAFNGKKLLLGYKINGEELAYKVPIVYSECNYGGQRPWFRCPNTRCDRRVGMLFLRGKYYLCRHCHQLAYETQNMSGPFRLLEQAQNIRERLGGSRSTFERFPERPKGMHRKTYLKLWHRYHRLMDMSWGMAADRWGEIAIG